MQEIQIFEYINKIMKITFEFSTTLLTVILIVSLILWLVGVKIKSEKAIKMGIRMSITFLVAEILLIGLVLLIANFKGYEWR